jgi:hypothetical protein
MRKSKSGKDTDFCYNENFWGKQGKQSQTRPFYNNFTVGTVASEVVVIV